MRRYLSTITPHNTGKAFSLIHEFTRAPASYGVQLEEGYHEMIAYNQRLPVKTTKIFETAMDNIHRATVAVACTRSILLPCSILATVEIQGVQNARAGIPKASITMSMDSNLRGLITIIDLHTKASGEKYFDGLQHLTPSLVPQNNMRD